VVLSKRMITFFKRSLKRKKNKQKKRKKPKKITQGVKSAREEYTVSLVVDY
jgi:hypothetical protein